MADIRIKSFLTKPIEDGSNFAQDLASVDETAKATAAAIADYVETKKGLTGLDTLTDKTFPLKSGGVFVDSSLTETETEIISTKSIRTTEPGSLIVGEMSISSAATQPSFKSDVLDKLQYVPLYDFVEATGSTKPHYAKATSGLQQVFLQGDYSEENSSGNIIFTSPTTIFFLYARVKVRFGSDATNVKVVIRRNTAEGAIVSQFKIDNIPTGIFEFYPDPAFFIQPGGLNYVTITFDTGSMLGKTIESQFVPYQDIDGYIYENTDIADADDITDANIKIKYENNADTNEFDDAEKAKLGDLPLNADLQIALDSAIHKAVDGEIEAIALKTIVDPDDVLLIENSEGSFEKKKAIVRSLPVVSLINSANTQNESIDANGFAVLSNEIAQFVPKFEVTCNPFFMGLTETPITDEKFCLKYRYDFASAHTITLLVGVQTVHSEVIPIGSSFGEIEFTILSTVWSGISGSFEFTILLDAIPVHKESVGVNTDINNFLVQSAHGGGYFLSANVTDCEVSGTNYKLDPVSAVEWPSFAIDYDPVLKRFVYTGKGDDLKFDVNWTCSVSNGTTVKYSLFKNGSNSNGIQRSRFFQNATSIISLSMGGILRLEENDYVEVFVSSSFAGVDVTTEEMQLVIN